MSGVPLLMRWCHACFEFSHDTARAAGGYDYDTSLTSFGASLALWVTSFLAYTLGRVLRRLERVRVAALEAVHAAAWPIVGLWRLIVLAVARRRARAWLRRNRPETAAVLERTEAIVQAHPGETFVEVYAIRGRDGQLLRLAHKPDHVALFGKYGEALAKVRPGLGEKPVRVRVPQSEVTNGKSGKGRGTPR